MMENGSICARQNTKLEELMNFLQYAVLDSGSRFRGIVRCVDLTIFVC